MADTARRAWTFGLCALDAVVGAALLIVGTYLIEPGLADLGFYLESGRYKLAGWFFIYAGLVLAHAAVFGLIPVRTGLAAYIVGLFFGGVARVGTGIVMLALAWKALSASTPVFGLTFIAIPGALAIASALLGGVAATQNGHGEGINAGRGKSAAGETIRAYLGAGVVAAITNALMVAYLGAGAFVYVLLEATLIDGIQIDVDTVWRTGAPRLAKRLWPIVAAVGLLSVIVVWLIGAMSAAQQWALHRRPGFDRNLSAEEVAFAKQCVGELTAYVGEGQLSRLAARLQIALVIGIVATIGGAAVFAVLAEPVVAWLYSPPSSQWQLYVVEGRWIVVMAILLGLSWAFAPGALASLLSERLAEERGMIRLRSRVAIEDAIVRSIRQGESLPGSVFDPGAFLRRQGQAGAARVLTCTAVATAAVAIAWPHDRATDTLYNEAGIETGEFWGMTRQVYAYSAVKRVELKCTYNSLGDKSVGSVIVLPGALVRSLWSWRALSHSTEALVRVDEALRAAGTKFVFALPEEPMGNAQVVDRLCVLELTERVEPSKRELVERLFHLDEWYERRWRLRTGKIYSAER